MRGLVAVAVGGGLQRLGLAAQLLRRGGDQAEDDEVEEREADPSAMVMVRTSFRTAAATGA